MSRYPVSQKSQVKGGFLLIELVGGIALLGLCGLLYALIQVNLSITAQQTELALRAVTELDTAIYTLELGHSIPESFAQKGPYKIEYKRKSFVVGSTDQHSGGAIPFQLVEATISWQSNSSVRSISGLAGIIL